MFKFNRKIVLGIGAFASSLRPSIFGLRSFLFFIFSFFFFLETNAQCAMCRAVLESEEGQTAAKGINDGIVYLMAVPYILLAGLGFAIYRKFFYTKRK